MVAVMFTFLVIFLVTRRQRQKVLELEQEYQLQSLANSRAYMMLNLEGQLDFLAGSSLEYNYTSLEVVGELGEGAFSKVYKAHAPGLEWEGWQENEIVAVKILKNESAYEAMQAFVSEVKISAKFHHKNVVQLIGVCTQTPQKCMIFEYMDLGNLKDTLQCSDLDKYQPTSPPPSHTAGQVILTQVDFLPCCLQVAQGLHYLAGQKFVHRDIATRNCLVNHKLVIKIADFGMSHQVSSKDYYRIESSKAYLPVRWMPPEALLYGKFTVKSDVWSYGVLMWEIYTYAQQPYGGISNHEVINNVKKKNLLHCPDLCPASIYDIMKSCWTHTPHHRPQMQELLERINNLLRISNLDTRDDYMPMYQAGSYLNLAYGVQVEEEELMEKKRVDEMLEHTSLNRSHEEEGGGTEEKSGVISRGDKWGTGTNGVQGKENAYNYVRIDNGMTHGHDLATVLVKVNGVQLDDHEYDKLKNYKEMRETTRVMSI